MFVFKEEHQRVERKLILLLNFKRCNFLELCTILWFNGIATEKVYLFTLKETFILLIEHSKIVYGRKRHVRAVYLLLIFPLLSFKDGWH